MDMDCNCYTWLIIPFQKNLILLYALTLDNVLVTDMHSSKYESELYFLLN